VSLVSVDEIAAIRAVAESGMETPVAVYRRTTVQTDDGQESVYLGTPNFTINGWLTEMTAQGSGINVLAGLVGVVETHRLMVPVGTDIRSGDKVVIQGVSYLVQHPSTGDTYAAVLTCWLRSIE
jgi:hypothetical protein